MPEVDVPALFRTGRSVLGIADDLEKALRAETRNITDPARGALGFTALCESNLPGTAMRWEAVLAGLVADVRAYGESLNQAATGYRDSDENAEMRLRASGHPAFAPRPGGAS